ncbi:hypothetical protein ACOSQ2_018616 [Xanthoceras sorbifolium]
MDLWSKLGLRLRKWVNHDAFKAAINSIWRTTMGFEVETMACLTVESGLSLGGMLGEVREIDKGAGGNCLGRLIRVKVLLDVLKPLKRGLRVDVGGEVFEVMTCYERLLNFCYFCGRMGHLIRDWPDNDVGLVDESKLRFGSWLRTPGPGRNRGSKSFKEEGEIG